jgi:hypothetical protein
LLIFSAGSPEGAKAQESEARDLKLTRKAIDLALEGDTTALRLCLERRFDPLIPIADLGRFQLQELAAVRIQ